jgi:hypothetical protein
VKTEALAAMLAAGSAPVPPHAAMRRLGLALLAGLPLALAFLLLAYGVRPDVLVALSWPMFWFKLLFAAAIGGAGFVAVQRLARPGVPMGLAWLGVAAPVLVVWAMALAAWNMAPPGARPEMLWGQTWKTCAFSIAALALPTFVATLVALRGLAPTRPALAGAAAGAMAGGAGAAVYALHCPELAAPFLALWYVAGMALPVVAGALVGPRLLRW